MKTLTLSLCQKNSIVGNLNHNFAIIETEFRKADSDIVVFPECFLTGYPLEDLVWDSSFMLSVAASIKMLEQMVFESKYEKALIVGAPHKENENIYNALYFITKNKTKVIKKIELPNFGVFDEKRNFTQGNILNNNNIIDYQGFRIGLGICEDFWHDTLPNYLISANVDFVISINGSPFELTLDTPKTTIRKNLAKKFLDNNIGFVYLNLVGGQDENVFDGNSFVLMSNNIFEFDGFKEQTEELLITKQTKWFKKKLTIHKNRMKNENSLIGLKPGLMSDTYSALVLGLRDYYTKSNAFKGIVIGLSGGVDSALDLMIAVDAIGPENVLAVRLPTKHSSNHSLQDAEELCKNLNVKMETIAIQGIVDTQNSNLSFVFKSFGKTVIKSDTKFTFSFLY